MEVNKSEAEVILKDVKVFKRIYTDNYEDLVNFSEAILFDQEEAQDVVQETFYYLWDNSDKIHIKSTIRAYLFSSVKHKSLNKIKHLKIKDEHADRVKEALLFSMTLDVQEDEEMLKKIDAIAEKFPEQMKKVFDLRKSDGMKYEEIAVTLGISVNCVKTHLKRAFRLLRETLLFWLILLSL